MVHYLPQISLLGDSVSDPIGDRVIDLLLGTDQGDLRPPMPAPAPGQLAGTESLGRPIRAGWVAR